MAKAAAYWIKHDYDSPVYDDKGSAGGCSLGDSLVQSTVPPIEPPPSCDDHCSDLDPRANERHLAEVLPQIKRVERRFAKRIARVQDDYAAQIDEVLKPLRKKRGKRN